MGHISRPIRGLDLFRGGWTCSEGAGLVQRGLDLFRGGWTCSEGAGLVQRGLDLFRGGWTCSEGAGLVQRGLDLFRGGWTCSEGAGLVQRGRIVVPLDLVVVRYWFGRYIIWAISFTVLCPCVLEEMPYITVMDSQSEEPVLRNSLTE